MLNIFFSTFFVLIHMYYSIFIHGFLYKYREKNQSTVSNLIFSSVCWTFFFQPFLFWYTCIIPFLFMASCTNTERKTKVLWVIWYFQVYVEHFFLTFFVLIHMYYSIFIHGFLYKYREKNQSTVSNLIFSSVCWTFFFQPFLFWYTCIIPFLFMASCTNTERKTNVLWVIWYFQVYVEHFFFNLFCFDTHVLFHFYSWLPVQIQREKPKYCE